MILHWWTQNSSEMSFYPPPLICVAEFEVTCFWHSFSTLCCLVDVVIVDEWSLLPISSPRAELATTSVWEDKYLGKDGLGLIGGGRSWAATVVEGEGWRWRISMYCSSNYAGFRFYNNNAMTMGEACLPSIMMGERWYCFQRNKMLTMVITTRYTIVAMISGVHTLGWSDGGDMLEGEPCNKGYCVDI